MDWLTSPGVICYERALGQLRRAGLADEDVPTRATAEQLLGVVHTEELPTAVASSGDHYVMLEKTGGGGPPYAQPGSELPRWRGARGVGKGSLARPPHLLGADPRGVYLRVRLLED